MALNTDNFTLISGADREKQIFFYNTSEDTLAQVLADDYFDDAGVVHQVKAGNVIFIKATDGVHMAQVSSVTTTTGSEDVTLLPLKGRKTYTTKAADTLEVPVTHDIVFMTTGADAEALTLADGYAGQELTLVLVADGGGDGTLTPENFGNGSTITFEDAGDSAVLVFDGTNWYLTGAGYGAPAVV